MIGRTWRSKKKALTYNCSNYLGWRTSYHGEPVENRSPEVFIARLRKKKELMKKGGLDASRDLPATSRRRTRDESIRVLKFASARQRERKKANKASLARQGEH